MTDKQLKNLLIPTPKKDEEFVQRVMSQLPKTDLSWRPVWAIRIVALVIGAILLMNVQSTPYVLWDIVYFISHNPVLSMGGMVVIVTVGSLWICRKNEII